MAPSPIFLLTLLAVTLSAAPAVTAPADGQKAAVPPYVHQCYEEDPQLQQCFVTALEHVRPFIAEGVPELSLASVEPLRVPELTLSLSSGPSGYRVTLRQLDLFGASDYSVLRLALQREGRGFEARLRFRELRMRANYTSSGVLLLLPAGGSGTFHATLGDVRAQLRGRVAIREESKEQQPQGSRRFAEVQTLALDLAVGAVNLHVRKAFNGNRILTEAMNLFLRENGHEVLKTMLPQLRGQLATVLQRTANQMLARVPVEMLLLPGPPPARP